MNGLPYYKAFPRDFIEGSVGMDFETKGAYRIVLDLIYLQGGNLPDDARYISGVLGCSTRRWMGLRKRLVDSGKIEVRGAFLGNKRADAELEQLAKLSARQSANRSKVGRENRETSVKLQDNFDENASTLNEINDLQEPRFDHTDTDTDKERTLPSDKSSGRGASADFERAIFTRGVQFLIRHGTAEKQARSIIGKWRKSHPDGRIFEAFADAARNAAVEPVGYITRILEGAENERLKAWGIPVGKSDPRRGRDSGSANEWDAKVDLSPVQPEPETGAPEAEMSFGDVQAGRDSLVLSPLRV